MGWMSASNLRYNVSILKLKYVSGTVFSKAKFRTAHFKATRRDYLQANSVDGALLSEREGPSFSRGLEGPLIMTTRGLGSEASQILSCISFGSRLNSVNTGMSEFLDGALLFSEALGTIVMVSKIGIGQRRSEPSMIRYGVYPALAGRSKGGEGSSSKALR
jgi:uncharacterized membrane protein